jgi:hypothetical protein
LAVSTGITSTGKTERGISTFDMVVMSMLTLPKPKLAERGYTPQVRFFNNITAPDCSCHLYEDGIVYISVWALDIQLHSIIKCAHL